MDPPAGAAADLGLPPSVTAPLSERLARSVAAIGERPRFADGRRPHYFALLDLPSKPFWRAAECEGADALLADLRANHGALLAEAQRVDGVDQGTLNANGQWFVHTVAGDGRIASPGTCPTLERILRAHACVCVESLFAACIISVLRAQGRIAPHYGPTNLRLRLQYPLTLNDECRLYCGDAESAYEDGYAIIDDAYAHWAHSGRAAAAAPRIVLVVDLWHPNITPDERVAIEQLLRVGIKM